MFNRFNILQEKKKNVHSINNFIWHRFKFHIIHLSLLILIIPKLIIYFSNLILQAVYMTTTVPQNIKGSNIAGRHTPTRTSLRHSRMIVVNKNYQGKFQHIYEYYDAD